MIGPADGVLEPAEGLCVVEMRGLNAVIDCETPSARMNCSRSSMLVRPFAIALGRSREYKQHLWIEDKS